MCFLYIFVLSLLLISHQSIEGNPMSQQQLNDRPIIGILSQELSITLNDLFNKDGKYSSYIAASYVKWVESAGGRVVPLGIDQNEQYYIDMLQKINGVLLPGGAINFDHDKGYYRAGEILYQQAWKYQVPIWGTCLGYELLLYANAREKGLGDPRVICNSYNVALPIRFISGFEESKLFKSATSEIINSLERENVTADFHHKCITKKGLSDFQLSSDWRVMSVNNDTDGLEFISTVESVTRPYFGVQFHPEKNMFEFKVGKAQPHTTNAIQVAQYFANFFISQARLNNNKYENVEDDIIYNFQPTYTGRNSSYEQIYFFEKPNLQFNKI